jgi:hypothetical protein
MPESPLGLVYAVRAFAASVASITRTILGFLEIRCIGMRRGKMPHVVMEYGLKAAANSSKHVVRTWFAAPVSISQPATPTPSLTGMD